MCALGCGRFRKEHELAANTTVLKDAVLVQVRGLRDLLLLRLGQIVRPSLP